MIEAQSLTRHYGDLVAVDGISFTVEKGQVLGFLGPNGAGKSTTMKILTGFLPPTTGTAIINGHDIIKDSLAARREIGYLPEGAPLYGEMSVVKFLQFVAHARGYRGAEVNSKAGQAAERLNLGHVLSQRIETLSKGYKRRVGLAQAVLHEPPVLVLDEPTDGLDPNQKHEVRELIRDMSENRIIIVSTHILEEVDALCNRAMIIANGRLVADDTPKGLIERSRYHNAVSLSMDDLQSAASILSDMPEAAKVEVRDNEITIFPESGSNLLAAVNRVIAEHNWQVNTLRLEAGRLDEVFRSITSEVEEVA